MKQRMIQMNNYWWGRFPYDVIYSMEANLDFSSPVHDMRKVYFVTDD